MSMSEGFALAIEYADFAAFFVTSKLVRSPRLPARDMGLDASPSPAIHTGRSVIFFVLSAFARMIHAAPSALAQQSKSFRGEDTIRDFNTSCMLIGFWNMAFGFFEP